MTCATSAIRIRISYPKITKFTSRLSSTRRNSKILFIVVLMSNSKIFSANFLRMASQLFLSNSAQIVTS